MRWDIGVDLLCRRTVAVAGHCEYFLISDFLSSRRQYAATLEWSYAKMV